MPPEVWKPGLLWHFQGVLNLDAQERWTKMNILLKKLGAWVMITHSDLSIYACMITSLCEATFHGTVLFSCRKGTPKAVHWFYGKQKTFYRDFLSFSRSYLGKCIETNLKTLLQISFKRMKISDKRISHKTQNTVFSPITMKILSAKCIFNID